MDIGTLRGQIAIEDQFTSVFGLAIRSAEEFGKSFSGALGAATVSAGVAVGAITAVTGAVVALAMKGSDVNDVADTFGRFAEKAGGADVVLSNLRGGVRGTVDDMTLMGNASRLLSVNAVRNAEDFGLLTEAAFVLQNRGLGSTEQMLNMVTQAMVSGQTRTLARTLGVVDAADAEIKYANKLGLSASQLTITQSAEARRIAVMDMLRSAVAEAGTQHMDFGEKVEAALSKVTNWWNKLASSVARSPQVMAAIDSITSALAGFGDGSDEIKTIVGWVNKFADAVTAWGPPIIKTFIEIKSWVVSIWNAVVAAWDTVPDWLKAVAKNAVVASIGVYALKSAVAGIGSAYMGAQQASTSFWGSMNDYATVTDAAISVGRLTAEHGRLAASYGVLSGAMTSAAVSSGLLNMTSATAAGGALGVTALGAVVAWTGGILAAGAAIMTAYQAYKLWSENRERAAAAERQGAIDSSNLAILNEKLGTSYKNVNDASAEWIRRNKEIKPVVDENAAATEAAAARNKVYERSVQGVIDAVRTEWNALGSQRDAFERLGAQILFTTEGQKKFVSVMDEVIASGGKLTDSENIKYGAIIRSRQATIELGVETLKADEVTVKAIDSARALGLSETELAWSFGVSTAALKTYESELRKLTDVRNEVADLELQASGRSAEAAEAARKREMEAAINSFRGTSIEFDEFHKNITRKYELQGVVGTSAWQEVEARSMSSLRNQAVEAERTLNAMIGSGNFFREDIEAQTEKVRELWNTYSNRGQEAAETTKTLGDNIRVVNEEWLSGGVIARAALNEQTLNVKTLTGEIISLTEAQRRQREGNFTTSMTYDLSTAEGMAHFQRLNPTATVNAGTDYFKTHTLQEAVQAGLVDFYGKMTGMGGFFMGTSTASANLAARGGSSIGAFVPPDLAMVTASTDVVSSAGAGGIVSGPVPGGARARGGTMINNFYVNGTAEDVARKVGDILIKKNLLQTRVRVAG